MSAYRHGETELKTGAGNLVILCGDEMAELPTDAVNSRPTAAVEVFELV